MKYNELFETIKLRLKKIAVHYNNFVPLMDAADLYQEMIIYLWQKYKDGVPEGINENYIVKGCEFHIRNLMRKSQENVNKVTLDIEIDRKGHKLFDLIPDGSRPITEDIDKSIALNYIRKNGFSKKDKKIFFLFLQGYTARQIGVKLNISHVAALKSKNKLLEKCKKRFQ
jgi:RNA polymerase sigma factor (sigma-70 family)